LTIIIVNYESWPDVVRLSWSLRDEPEFRSGDCEVLVVDNASRGPVPAELDASGGGLRLIARPDNGGFAVGVNAGWQQARGSWLLVLNPDIEVAPGFLRGVFGRLDHHEARPEGPPGIIGFGLHNPDGSPQGSVGAFPSLGRSIREQFRPRSRRKYRPGWNLRTGRVDWVTGACMLVNATLMCEVGGMDEDFFLYHEEVALCRVARRRGWRVEYDPAVRVVHRHPLQNRPISPKMRVITRHSKLLYFHKHLPRWQFRTLVAIVRCDSAIRRRWAAIRGRAEEERAWVVVGQVARRLLRGDVVRGGEILTLASAPAAGSGPSSPHRRRHRNRGARGSVRATS
jgi:GT2 family glycosyltransferase